MSERSNHDERIWAASQHEQHARLNSMIRALDHRLHSLRESVSDVSHELGDLGYYLEEHFEAEEQGGYFRLVIERAPHLASRAGRLEVQHPDLMQQAHQLVERISACLHETDQLQSGFEHFSKELAQHEQGENELLQDAYTQDIGSQD